MLNLLVTVLFALAITYFSLQNTIGVTLVIANNVIYNVPLYAVVIGSVALGILMATIITSIKSISYYMSLRGKDHIIHEDAKIIHMLQNKMEVMEVENARLKNEEVVEAKQVEEPIVQESNRPIHRPSFFRNLLHFRT